jgi:hypothetical protein
MADGSVLSGRGLIQTSKGGGRRGALGKAENAVNVSKSRLDQIGNVQRFGSGAGGEGVDSDIYVCKVSNQGARVLND